MTATRLLYREDDHQLTAQAIVVGIQDRQVALHQTCFYPGGGGQPPDHGYIADGWLELRVLSIAADESGVLWHECETAPPASWLGSTVALQVDAARRTALARYHTVLHVLNTIAQRDYGAWMTGAQIEMDYSRIDFKWDGFTPAVRAEVEAKVNAELTADRRLVAYWIPEAEFAQKPELLRTLEVRPPVLDGRVRVVAIEGFDAQACGGTHVHSTGELGRFSITRTDNKGKINRRFYIQLSFD